MVGDQIEDACSGSIGGICSHDAGEAKINVIFGSQNLVDAGEHFRLLIPIPHYLEEGVTSGWKAISSGEIPVVRVDS